MFNEWVNREPHFSEGCEFIMRVHPSVKTAHFTSGSNVTPSERTSNYCHGNIDKEETLSEVPPRVQSSVTLQTCADITEGEGKPQKEQYLLSSISTEHINCLNTFLSQLFSDKKKHTWKYITQAFPLQQ